LLCCRVNLFFSPREKSNNKKKKCSKRSASIVFIIVVVLLGWAAELHHNCSLTPPPQRGTGRKYDEKGSRIEIRIGRSYSNYRDGQNRLSMGR